jgi:hypothetical protein
MPSFDTARNSRVLHLLLEGSPPPVQTGGCRTRTAHRTSGVTRAPSASDKTNADPRRRKAKRARGTHSARATAASFTGTGGSTVPAANATELRSQLRPHDPDWKRPLDTAGFRPGFLVSTGTRAPIPLVSNQICHLLHPGAISLTRAATALLIRPVQGRRRLRATASRPGPSAGHAVSPTEAI